MGPFLHILNQVDLDDYSYIVKLHTKRTSKKTKGSAWREHLLSFLASPSRFNSYLAAFDSHPRIGMQGDYHVFLGLRKWHDPEGMDMLYDWLRGHGEPRIRMLFVAGTMFIVRAALMKRVQEYGMELSDFPVSAAHSGSLAHVWERLFGYFIYRQGYILADRHIVLRAACFRSLSDIAHALVVGYLALFRSEDIKSTLPGRIYFRLFRKDKG